MRSSRGSAGYARRVLLEWRTERRSGDIVSRGTLAGVVTGNLACPLLGFTGITVGRAGAMMTTGTVEILSSEALCFTPTELMAEVPVAIVAM